MALETDVPRLRLAEGTGELGIPNEGVDVLALASVTLSGCRAHRGIVVTTELTESKRGDFYTQ